MLNYFRALGFSTYTREDHILPLLTDVHENPDYIECCDLKDTTFVTMEKDIMEDSGIGIFGSYDAYDRFQIEYYYVYHKTKEVSGKEVCLIIHLNGKEAFQVTTDDTRLGVPLHYYLINTNGFFDAVNEAYDPNQALNYHLSALSLSGSILLPLLKDTETKKRSDSFYDRRKEACDGARRGKPMAYDAFLGFEEALHQMTEKQSRMMDLYSIIDTSFIPVNEAEGDYKVLAEITDVKLHKNPITREECYLLSLKACDIPFELLINKMDLLGEPLVGRRFLGQIHLQGYIDFPV